MRRAAGRGNEPEQALEPASGRAPSRMGLRIVAEGIEDSATLDQLTGIGCDVAQGYFISRPVPAAQLDVGLEDAAPSPTVARLATS